MATASRFEADLRPDGDAVRVAVDSHNCEVGYHLYLTGPTVAVRLDLPGDTVQRLADEIPSGFIAGRKGGYWARHARRLADTEDRWERCKILLHAAADEIIGRGVTTLREEVTVELISNVLGRIRRDTRDEEVTT